MTSQSISLLHFACCLSAVHTTMASTTMVADTIKHNRLLSAQLDLTLTTTLASLGWTADMLRATSDPPSTRASNASSSQPRQRTRPPKPEPPAADYSQYPLIVTLPPMTLEDAQPISGQSLATEQMNRKLMMVLAPALEGALVCS